MSRHRPEVAAAEAERTGEIVYRPRTHDGQPVRRHPNYGVVLMVAAVIIGLLVVTTGAAMWLAEYLSDAPVWVSGAADG